MFGLKMLGDLLGNQNVERVLLFLLVNEECYAHQIRRVLGVSLTPIQNALARLEKAGVVCFELRKNARIYRFNPSYLLLPELESLLKKTYHFLKLEEKKRYHYLKTTKKQSYRCLSDVWQRMKSVTQVRMMAKDKGLSNVLWKGKGHVQVREEGWSLLFKESGKWEGKQGNYKNAFCWTWNRLDDLISLEHLRLGKEDPKFMFNLLPSEEMLLESSRPQLTIDNTYFGWLEISDLFLHLHIRTLGPKKNEKVEYVYS
ncbi:MAG: hypothetical protein SP1CHLAM54_10070 [Chlamydiia bacterium]|nr:hypothetical protein [Chlamydiia bacterium]MCH9615913.1 hypothetical protein [Chlamydiia bacterium]MCH9628684.1 hypothetical protein [Chlamydiia bacterium]